MPLPQSLMDTVVAGGYCTGCGACASGEGAPIEIRWREGRYYPAIKADASEADVVCPFADDSVNEDTLGHELYGQAAESHQRIGYHAGVFAGYVNDGHRGRGSSGGMGSWIVETLLAEGLVDGVVHVLPQNVQDAGAPLFAYGISRTVDEVRRGAKSRYYPVQIAEVMALIRANPGRYAVVGLPCFIKSVRLLQLRDNVLKERVAYTVALFCGHLKSAGFGESLAWESGVTPDDLATVDFRVKLPNRPANRYGFSATSRQTGQTVVQPMTSLTAADWGVGLFRLEACDYCDDVVGETADIAVGDAWLPQYVGESEGTNVVVVRKPEVLAIVRAAMADGRLALEEISADMAAKSQDAGLRHRREGLSYRLWLKDKAGLWRPRKRVIARADHLNRRQKKIQITRMAVAKKSHLLFAAAKEAGDLRVFLNGINPELRRYRAINNPRWLRLVRAIKRRLKTYLVKLKG